MTEFARRRHQQCERCRASNHNHHVGAKCLTPVDQEPLDFVCLCSVDRKSNTTVVLLAPIDPGIRGLLEAISSGPIDHTIFPDELVCRRCDIPVSLEREVCPFCERPLIRARKPAASSDEANDKPKA